jgi:hypothetical protein
MPNTPEKAANTWQLQGTQTQFAQVIAQAFRGKFRTMLFENQRINFERWLESTDGRKT